MMGGVLSQRPDDLIIKPFAFYWKSFWQFPIRMMAMLIMEIMQACMLVLLPYAVKDIVTAADSHDPALGSVWNSIHDPFMTLVWLTIGMAVCSRISGTVLLFVARNIRRMPRIWLFEHLLKHSMEYFSNRHSGALGAKIHDVTHGMAMATWTLLFDFIGLLILFVASSVTVGSVNMPLGVMIFIWGTLYVILISLLTVPRIYWIEGVNKERANITGRIIDSVANIFSLKAYAHANYEQSLLTGVMKQEESAVLRYGLWGEAIHWTHFILTFALITGSVYFAVETYEAGKIELATISYLFTLVLILSTNARHLTWSLQAFMEYVGQIRDGIHTIMREHEIADESDAKPLEMRKGEINFDKVSFGYSGQGGKSVIENLNLNVPSGQKLGLVGSSGAGKSTLVSLLLRFYETDTGNITIDGQDLSRITQDSLRENISVIPQDTSLFHRSLADNIRYGCLDATDEDIIDAAKKAHAHDFIKDLPKGYETMVGERGLKLSGGQRQRIAIARAILKNAPILILDEATSALDSESEQLIQDSLFELMKGKTVIAIAHRLSTIAKLDRLIVMEQGRIVEDGNHEALLKSKGHYAKLWDMQSGGFLGDETV
ncbi:MAG: ABC transporter ATP-binding protein [Pseudomonadota bacterium]|nr:ABC transporter ATP-binding protein [Pseudomonadota bacterium]